jgi:HSP20 family protein
VTRINEEKVGSMSALTRRGHRGSFCRRVALPETADEADIQASYDNGILEISVGLEPDRAADHAGRSVPIRLVQHIKPT